MQGSFRTLEQSASVSKKLVELEGKQSSKKSKQSFDKSFASRLFASAPEAFLKRTDIPTLDLIYRESKQAIESFLNSKEDFTIQFNQELEGSRSSYSRLLLVTEERAFIIDTLLELANISQIDTSVILYPSTEVDGRLVTVIYAEFEKITNLQKFANFKKLITETYSDLVLVTDHFSKMLEQCEYIKNALIKQAAIPKPGENCVDVDNDHLEIAEFVDYAIEQNFIFMGYRRWEIEIDSLDSADIKPKRISSLDLGIFCSKNKEEHKMLEDLDREAEYLIKADKSFLYSRYYYESKIHRHQLMNILSYKTISEDGKKIQLHSFIGLVKYFFLQQFADVAPIVRKKLEYILRDDKVLPGSYDDREVRSIFRGLSRLRLLQGDVPFIRKDIKLIFESKKHPQTDVLYCGDVLNRFASIVAVMPRTRFSDATKMRLQNYLEKEFDVEPGSTDHYVIIVDHRLVRLHYLLPNRKQVVWNVDEERIKKEIIHLSHSWKDRFLFALREEYERNEAQDLFNKYIEALPGDYKEANSHRDAVTDVRILETLTTTNACDVSLTLQDDVREDQQSATYMLTVYQRGTSQELGDIFPRLQNIGFQIHFQNPTEFYLDDQLYSMHKFCVSIKKTIDHVCLEDRSYLIPGLRRILAGRSADDKLNSLLVRTDLTLDDVVILRTLQQYILQIRNFRDHMLVSALVDNIPSLLLVLEYFKTKFDPELTINQETRDKKLKDVRKHFEKSLKNVARLLDDQILRAFFNVISATVRTNYFQKNYDEVRVGIKIDSSLLEDVGGFKPAYETFIYTPEFQGVHLRGGKVARGGIRWSDRSDVRREVRGLLEAQMVKNTIIVPVGAKGGFYIKRLSQDHLVQQIQVEECYKKYIRTLLELTDNVIEGEIVHPESTIIYDDADPYLFIAADRGTADFSDLANSIAISEFNFWLADAFASGGTNGYNHKEIGITSGTAWVAAERHFRELGIDIHKQEITVAGIGDMSGDVFGNGLLHSKNIKLIAAFNHKHIFIDPSPDCEVSYQERQRLFLLPRSNWTDYNPKLISEGGGVFERDQKEISLSKEAAACLGTNETVVSGTQLISIILKSPVDLLWNGGIGTYVRASLEDDMEIGDRSNDEVRVDARDLRVRVVAEGGNRGFTQRARIEYSKIGGRINTDAVDNSGGVDLSDREVQLKIALSAPLRRGELTLDDRNALLASFADEAKELVLSRTYMQTQAISVAEKYHRRYRGEYAAVIKDLERRGLLDREAEFLTDEKSLSAGAGLSRPELAVLLAYVRRYLKDTLLKSSILDDPYMKKYLKNYFPGGIRESFPDDVISHPIGREIIITRVTNSLVERMGPTFIHRHCQEAGHSVEDVVFAVIVANALVGTRTLFEELKVMDRADDPRRYLRAVHNVSLSLDRITRWVLSHWDKKVSIDEMSSTYFDSFQLLFADKKLVTSIFPNFQKTKEHLVNEGFSESLAQSLASVEYVSSYLDIVEISLKTSKEVADIAILYGAIQSKLQTVEIIQTIAELKVVDVWDRTAIRNANLKLRESVADITLAIIEAEGSAELSGIEKYFESRENGLRRYRETCEELQKEEPSLYVFLAASSHLASLAPLTKG